ncbi:MAG TPA: HAMP domain-containing sensor histidine kinase [Puia sp.]|nr:HAMP domain-containing sensor histidine kinase [Puia sp.]
MKLLTKLTLFITLSKLAIVVLFVSFLPSMVSYVAFQFTNSSLREQKAKVMRVIDKNGIDYYFQGDSSYGSYTMLKEEYISLVRSDAAPLQDTIETSQRVVENDTINYRVLIHSFNYAQKRYTLEIGKTTASIGQYNNLLQRFTFYVLIGLIVLTIMVDLLYTNYLIRPLRVIIKTKLLNTKFPFKEHFVPIKTSTSDFQYLDNALVALMQQIKQAFDKEREFTSNASHELLTPISILQTKMENLMISSDISEEMQESISGMMKTLSRLRKIVQSLLFISRIENDQFVKKGEIKVIPLMAEMMEELGHRMESKNIGFSMQVSEKIILRDLNHDLVFQLLYNLVNNAIRYNREGGEILISDEYLPGAHYTLFIKDTGIGIPAGEVSTIFDRFKKSALDREEGYGLGLYIVKTIAGHYGLTIEVQSEPGNGTIFSIIFPQELVVVL